MASIKHGFWVDHNSTVFYSYRYLVSERQAATTSNAIAVALTLALPRLYIVFQHSISMFSRSRKTSNSVLNPRSCFTLLSALRNCLGATRPTSRTTELTEFSLAGHNQGRRILNGILQTLKSSPSMEGAVSRLARRHLAMPQLANGDADNFSKALHQVFKNFAEDPKAFVSVLAIITIFLTVWVGLQIIATSSNYIIGNSVATIKGGSCSYSFTKWDDRSSVLRSLSKRVESGAYIKLTLLAIDYAKSCYSAQSPMTRCRDLVTPTLAYNITTNGSCPFPSNDMCKLGDNSGIIFDTGFQSSKLLGINTGSTLEFRRRTTCVPVNDNETYVSIRKVSDSEVRIDYSYVDKGSAYMDGIMGFTSMSETRSIGPDLDSKRLYDVWYGTFPRVWSLCLVIRMLRSPTANGWRGLHPRLVSEASATTLFLIRPNIVYSTYSDDPIFPAKHELYGSSTQELLWRDISTARRMLACSDEKSIRDPTSQSQWYVLAETLHDRKSNDSWDIRSPSLKGSIGLPLSNSRITELRLLALVLRSSDIAQAVYFPTSPWLNGALPVAYHTQAARFVPDQWQLESRKLFNIFLARMQAELWYMARGEQLGPSEFGYDMFEHSLVDPSSMLKIKADGMKNINVLAFLAMLGLVPTLWILSMEINDTIILFWIFGEFITSAISSLVFLPWKAGKFVVDFVS